MNSPFVFLFFHVSAPYLSLKIVNSAIFNAQPSLGYYTLSQTNTFEPKLTTLRRKRVVSLDHSLGFCSFCLVLLYLPNTRNSPHSLSISIFALLTLFYTNLPTLSICLIVYIARVPAELCTNKDILLTFVCVYTDVNIYY